MTVELTVNAKLDCLEVDEAGIAVADKLDPSRRRGLFAIAGAVVGGLALRLDKTPARATGCLGEPDCCDLATCKWCNYAVSRDRFNCSEWPGYKRTTWSCRQGTRLAWCGECAKGPTCDDGGWKCSIWFWN